MRSSCGAFAVVVATVVWLTGARGSYMSNHPQYPEPDPMDQQADDTAEAAAPYVPSYVRRGYTKTGAHGAASPYSPSKTAYAKTSYVKTHSVKTAGSTKTGGSYYSPYLHQSPAPPLEECAQYPSAPANTHVSCVGLSRCRLTCREGHAFSGVSPPADTQLILQCTAGAWHVEGRDWPIIPPCEPVCLPACENNGVCVSPGECSCPDNFVGAHCQYERRPCLNYPPPTLNAHRSCSRTHCTIKCMDGHQFPDGSTLANLLCEDGEWTPARKDWPAIPDCGPLCRPPCLNGGVCLALDTCQCPQDYRGPSCEYPASACGSAVLGFNGAFTCAGDGSGVQCALSCPEGARFSTPPAPAYTCRYSEGHFEPEPVPRCIFDEGVGVSYVGGAHSYSAAQKLQHQHDDNVHFMHSGSAYHSMQSEGQDQESWKGWAWQAEGGNEGQSIAVVEPTPGTCTTWAGAHYHTFDGRVYSVKSSCRVVLVRETRDRAFTVAVQHSPATSVHLYINDEHYILQKAEGGEVVVVAGKGRALPVPVTLAALRVTRPARHTLLAAVDSLSLLVHWDTEHMVSVSVGAGLWNRTEGMCGALGGPIFGAGPAYSSPLATAQLYSMHDDEDSCQSEALKDGVCGGEGDAGVERAAAARAFCTRLISKPKFRQCAHVMDMAALMSTCEWDYCQCAPPSDGQECACAGVSVFARQCVRAGVTDMLHWRDDDTCPMSCDAGTVYRACGAATAASCALDAAEEADPARPELCVEGCYCAAGLVREGARCLPRAACPCRHRGRTFPPNATVPSDCNSCLCVEGSWVCSQRVCGARCAAVGDPHYVTFDGRRYDFMGRCEYTLVHATPPDALPQHLKHDTTIIVENVACPGTISEALGMAVEEGADMPSCTREVVVQYAGVAISLQQGARVLVDGHEAATSPAALPLHLQQSLCVRQVSSLFIQVEVPNGINVMWDGLTRVYVDVPGSMRTHTMGLCGTFNGNQEDDFLTPAGDVETSRERFAARWATPSCPAPAPSPPHPCHQQPEHKEKAQALCDTLMSKLFQECHLYVEVGPWMEACLADVCACGGADAARCLCPVLGAYAMECARHGPHVPWRLHVPLCEVQCSGGQTYQVCADTCARTCTDVEFNDGEVWECRGGCAEGCACPTGQTLLGTQCVPIARCPCHQRGLEFPPGYAEVRAGIQHSLLCTCGGPRWQCREATLAEAAAFPPADALAARCNASLHFEFTPCLASNPATCQSMAGAGVVGAEDAVSQCRGGCACAAGYVLDSTAGACVEPARCPCLHAGRSHPPGHSIQDDCNTCVCEGGSWACTKHACWGECAVWGGSHFATFDRKRFQFQAACLLLMAKGHDPATNTTFALHIQEEACGRAGATCSRGAVLRVGSHVVTLTSPPALAAPSPSHTPAPPYRVASADEIDTRVVVYEMDGWVVVSAGWAGLSLRWDRASTLYLRLRPSWATRVTGLCGNYNGEAGDDWAGPSGGPPEASLLPFLRSWYLQPDCPDPSEPLDYCEVRSERASWANSICAVLKREPFNACHHEVEVSPWVSWCEGAACACDSGEDCGCVCAALQAYAHACTARGVPLRWRTPDLCPMQCEASGARYEACVSACPDETCANTLQYADLQLTCAHDTCFDGCKREECGSGLVRGEDGACVARASCGAACATVGGRGLLEGERVALDACHACTCARGQLLCLGEPCPQPTEGEDAGDAGVACVRGWSAWVSAHTPRVQNVSLLSAPDAPPRALSIEHEPLPFASVLRAQASGGVCAPGAVADIECREVGGAVGAGAEGEGVECGLERGLYCRRDSHAPCPDYEIRVYCACDGSSEMTTSTKAYTTHEVSAPAPLSTDGPAACPEGVQYSPHPSDCRKFYQCGAEGAPVEKSCTPGTFYHPLSMVCDWEATVIAVNPHCADTESSTAQSSSVVTQSTAPAVTSTAPTLPAHMCGEGEVWSPCAVQCTSLCHYHRDQLQLRRLCTGAQVCEGGCVRADTTCAPGWVRRDAHTCVPPEHCTCASHSHTMLKPSEVVVERECVVCQCLDNHYTCDDSACMPHVLPLTPVSGSHQAVILSVPTLMQTAPTSHPTPTNSTISLITSTSSSATPVVTFTTASTPAVLTSTVTISTAGAFANSTLSPSSTSFSSRVTEPSATWMSTESSTEVLVTDVVWSAPPDCPAERHGSLVWEGLQPSMLSASSERSAAFAAENAVLNARTTDISAASWSPAASGAEADGGWVQVSWQRAQPVYGVSVQGSPLYDHYVTAFHLLYSHDGVRFHHATHSHQHDKVFPGGLSHEAVATTWLSPAVEARVVRIVPVAWHNDIAVRFDLIGCLPAPNFTTSPATLPSSALATSTPSSVSPCGDGEPQEVPAQVSASSWADDSVKDADALWRPRYDNPSQWLQLSMAREGVVVGVRVRGAGGAWVQALRVRYSQDGRHWNELLDSNPPHDKRTFSANYDEESVVSVWLGRGVRARYVRLEPVTWHDHIALQAQLLLCPQDEQEPVSTTEDVETTEPSWGSTVTTLSDECPVCPGAPYDGRAEGGAGCACVPPLYYDGEACVERARCPCYQGFIPWAVGSVYFGGADGCERCVCALGGQPSCSRPACPASPPCPKGSVKRAEGPSCACGCVACAAGERACADSVCLPAARWCDGVADCADDELHCDLSTTPTSVDILTTLSDATVSTTEDTTTAEDITTTEIASTTEGTISSTTAAVNNVPITTGCESVVQQCPPGYKAVRRGVRTGVKTGGSLLSAPAPRRPTYRNYYKGSAAAKTVYQGVKTRYSGAKLPKEESASGSTTPRTQEAAGKETQSCEAWSCVRLRPLPGRPAAICQAPRCPPPYKLRALPTLENGCPKYECEIAAMTQEVRCEVSGEAVRTLHGERYHLQPCDQLLAADGKAHAFAIHLKEDCDMGTGAGGRCVSVWESGEEEAVMFGPGGSVRRGLYRYTAGAGAGAGSGDGVNRLAAATTYTSPHNHFSLIITDDGDLTIAMEESFADKVEGLCGSRGVEQQTVEGACHARPACPLEMQQQAHAVCQRARSGAFRWCAEEGGGEAWVEQCVERVCRCRRTASQPDAAAASCACEALAALAARCLAADPPPDMPPWRTTFNCPSSCKPPLVHHDCYRRRCEPACAPGGGESAASCDPVQGVCFPGCYCPEGTLRTGDECVTPTDCHNCECQGGGGRGAGVWGWGGARAPLPHTSCTYLLTAATADTPYQVYLSVGVCLSGDEEKKASCVRGLHVTWPQHDLHLLHTRDHEIESAGSGGVAVERGAGGEVLATLPELHLQVSMGVDGAGEAWFSVRAPSHVLTDGETTSGAGAGLCGVCGSQPLLYLPDSSVTNDTDTWFKGWAAPAEGAVEEAVDALNLGPLLCEEPAPAAPQPTCLLPTDECLALTDPDKFGPCLQAVEVWGEVERCVSEACAGRAGAACDAAQRYAALCRRQKLCPAWRSQHFCPLDCPAGLVYGACESGCGPATCAPAPAACALPPQEGCFCPPHQVMMNGSCVSARECARCEDGHYAGDEWQEGPCKRCGCVAGQEGAAGGAREVCVSEVCATRACAPGETPLTLPAKFTQCCPTVICRPPSVSLVTCEEPKPILCGEDQRVQVISNERGCQHLVCVCKSEEECSSMGGDGTGALPAGEEWTREVSPGGCCEAWRAVCRPASCPALPPCAPPTLLTRQQQHVNVCCPAYTCEPPRDMCGVRLPSPTINVADDSSLIYKSVGEQWSEGPCRACECVLGGTVAEVRCAVRECGAPLPPPAGVGAALRTPPGACCPRYEHTHCIHEGRHYKRGEVWREGCVRWECEGRAEDQLALASGPLPCNTTCAPGEEYVVREGAGEDACCGVCEKRACEVEGVRRALGETWRSPDNCTRYTCALPAENRQAAPVVERWAAECAGPSPDELAQYVLEPHEAGACCPAWRRVACLHNNTRYHAGAYWETAQCERVVCATDETLGVAGARGVSVRVEAVPCPACPAGAARLPPAPPVCCPPCHQTHCTHHDKLYELGAEWSSDDNCTQWRCVKSEEGKGEQVEVREMGPDCPSIGECPAHRRYTLGCCTFCHDECEVTWSGGVGRVEARGRGARGICRNERPLPEFTECRGHCASHTAYDAESGAHVASCSCCAATRYRALVVPLRCADGSELQHQVAVPAACACAAAAQPCSPAAPTTAPTLPTTDTAPLIDARLSERKT